MCSFASSFFLNLVLEQEIQKLSVEINMILEHMYFFSKYFKSVLFYAYD